MRVLHREANLDAFEVGADALKTRWDGKGNDGSDLPPGQYHANGYVAAPMKIQEVTCENPNHPEMPQTVRVKLVANPLENNERPVVELAVGFDDQNVFLQTANGLPLQTIMQNTDVQRGWITQRADKSLDVFLDDGTSTRTSRRRTAPGAGMA